MDLYLDFLFIVTACSLSGSVCQPNNVCYKYSIALAGYVPHHQSLINYE